MIFSPIILEASWLWVMETNKYLISLEEPLGANLKFWLKTEGAYARGRGGGHYYYQLSVIIRTILIKWQ